MIKFTKIYLSVIALLAVLAMISCSSKDEPHQNVSNESHSCKMIFNVTKTGFSDELNTRSAAQWENGDTIYLLFTSGENIVYGDAVYNEGEWFVNYNGSLITDQETKCRAVYFENNVSSTHSTITLNETSAIYEDFEGKYTLTDGSLSVTANLKPKTGRIRFKGTNHEEIKVYGITHYTSFNRYTGEFSSTKEIINSKVESDYAPYIYGAYTDTVEPRINVWKANEGFTRIFPKTIYKAGESGYVTIPTSSSHNGWQTNVILKVNNVEFTMIPVKYSSGNFLMAQTETTEELYEAVMNDGNSSKLPKTGLSRDNWSAFLSTLNAITQISFLMPSYEEWKVAFNGGDENNSFSYSGSDNIDEVAWYNDNSNNTVHSVATKQPNELGFYDMSGNVFEFVSDTGWDCYGGSWNSNASGCKSNSVMDYSPGNRGCIGLRLYMSNKTLQ